MRCWLQHCQLNTVIHLKIHSTVTDSQFIVICNTGNCVRGVDLKLKLGDFFHYDIDIVHKSNFICS